MKQFFKDPTHKGDQFEVHAEHVFVKVPMHNGTTKQVFLTKDAVCEMYEAILRDDRSQKTERVS